MSSATTALKDVFGLCVNPSTLSLNSGLTVAVFATRLFDQPELTYVCSGMSLWNVGLFVSSLGNDIYRETALSAGCGLKCHGISFGVSAKGMALSIRDYGSDITIGLDAGVVGLVNKRLAVAAVGKNINLPTLGSCGDEIAPMIRLGTALFLADDLLLCADLSRESGQETSISVGQELWLYPQFAVRGGLSTAPLTFSGGFGLGFASVSVDYSVMVHNPLGLTHGLTLCYTVGRR